MEFIHKAAGIIIQDRALLVERSHGKEHFIAPGGKIESDETPQQALVRELKEEFGITAKERSLELFGTFTAAAAGRPGMRVEMEAFIVKEYAGTPSPQSEVEEIRWVTSVDVGAVPIGSIFAQQVIPRLVARGLLL
jgi:mutator protein MutT